MKLYDTLIIGSGYFSVGYALAKGNCMIAEEHQICDTGFYLPLRSFSYRPYEPVTEEGRRLATTFSELGLFSDGMQNTNAFECAFCRYLLSKDFIPTLKCRVISQEKLPDGTYSATLQTNEGLTEIRARHILDTRSPITDRRLTMLYLAKSEDVGERLLSAFPGSTLEPAFYAGRYALHIPVNGYDENTVKPWIHQRWCELGLDAKILYIAPVFYHGGDISTPGDGQYRNPIEAFEAGYLYAGGNAQ